MLGGQYGLTPLQILDMNMPMINAYIEGCQEHLFDMQCIAVHQGYWAGYYQSKKPKLPNVIIERMIREHNKKHKKNLPKPEVNVGLFMQREARRLQYLAKQKERGK